MLLLSLPALCCLASTDYRFQRLSLEQGLSQSTIFAMAEDPAGYLWFGTEQGADRFDGYQIKTLRHAPHLERSIGHSRVQVFHTDANGEFWIGTQHGLNRVDPATGAVKSFHVPDDPGRVPGTFGVDRLADACGGYLLILTNQGPWLLDRLRDLWTPLFGAARHEGEVPTSLHASKQGDIWLASHQSLWRLDCSSLELESVAVQTADHQPVPASGSDLIASLPDGRLIWASGTGLKLQAEARVPQSFRSVVPSDGYEAAIPRAVHVDPMGRVWAFLPEEIVRIDGDQLAHWTPALALGRSLGRNRNYRLESAISGDGVFWLAGLFGMAVQSDPDQPLQMIRHDPANPDSIPPSLHQVGYRIQADRFGVVWIGANLGGVARYVPSQHRFEHVADMSLDANNVVRGMIETEYGGSELLWIGIEFGGVRIYRREQGEYQRIRTLTAATDSPAQLPGNRIAAMARQPGTNRVWLLGSDWLGWLDGDPASPRFVRVDVAPDFRSARHLAFSDDGRKLFVANSSYVGRTSADTDFAALQRLYPDDPRAPSSDFTPVLPLSTGQLAVGCRRGLNLIDPETGHGRRISLWPDEPLSPVNFVFSLHESADGRLWMGTHGGGLASVFVDDLAKDYPPIEWLSTDDGLADNTVYAMLEDRKGCLWLTGNRGISHWCPGHSRVRNFSLRDGLQGYEFNGRAADIGHSGRFYFGGINGVNIFRPADVNDHPLPPEVRLQQIRIGEQPLEWTGSEMPRLTLTHRDNSLVIDYLALHFVAPEAIEYAYRLVGLDQGWVDAGVIRQARYPSLQPGNYEFQVRAASADGVWSPPETLMTATIQPPPWRTAPAYGAYLVALIGLLLAIAWSVAQRRRELEAQVDLRTRELAERNQTVVRQAAELEKLLQSRQTLYANVSHELRTPLTLIRAALDRLNRNPHDAEAVALGERYVRRLDRLIDQLLDLSRVRAEAFKPEGRPWSLSDWLRELVRDHATVAEDRQLQLDFVPQGDWQTTSNRELLDKCLTNLLSNALKYTPPGGQIIVRLGGSAEQADIEVADTGHGIAPEDQASIFERFQRLPAHESQPEKGAGIGLALVHEAAAALSGEIRLESQPGKGSRFILTIPAGKVTAAVQRDEPEADSPAMGIDQSDQVEQSTQARDEPTLARPSARLGTLLIVEDNADLRRHLQGLLRDQWKILTAEDGRQALARLAAHEIDVILSDIMMPNMDGLDLLKRIRNDLATSHIPFLILTARRDTETRLQGFRLSADAILTKPFDDEELRLRLANTASAIERRRRHETIENGDQPELAPRDQAFIEQVNAWLEVTHGDSDTRINDLARHLHLDERTLQRKTRALFGKSPKTVLTEYRLDRAVELLREVDRKIADVAAECGFSSPSYFARQFAKRFGQAPGSWQKAKNPEKP